MTQGIEYQLTRIADALEGKRYVYPSARFQERFPHATIEQAQDSRSIAELPAREVEALITKLMSERDDLRAKVREGQRNRDLLNRIAMVISRGPSPTRGHVSQIESIEAYLDGTGFPEPSRLNIEAEVDQLRKAIEFALTAIAVEHRPSRFDLTTVIERLTSALAATSSPEVSRG